MPRPKSLNLLRRHMRGILETWPDEFGEPLAADEQVELRRAFPAIEQFDLRLRAGAGEMRELFVGMANSPFLLIFRAADPEAFVRYADAHPSHQVNISWTHTQHPPVVGTVTPLETPNAYSLSFGLPEAIETWIFSAPDRPSRYAAKAQVFSDITIYRHVEGTDRLYRLIYNARDTRRQLRLQGRRLTPVPPEFEEW